MIYNILDFGAKGDAVTNDANSIQAAVDACHNNGGGRVLLPGGKTYNSGSIILKSNVEFHLEMGAILKASSSLEDYYPLANNGEIVAHSSGLPSYLNSDYAGRPFHAFIYALDGENICISGMGKIDATEEMFYGHDSGYHIEGTYYPRIPLMLLENIKNLTIKDLTLINCAFWTVHLVGCNEVLVDGVRIINNLKMANSDGIDPDHCKNVKITNCHIECGDDCIVLKNSADYTKYGSCENIVISGCTLISTSAAIKIGTESVDDFKNIIVSNCTISNSNRGISLQLRDKGNIENVIFSNINIETRRFSHEWWGRAEPIAITAIDRNENSICGQIKNIKFKDINCQSENGIFIYGREDRNIKDVSFENITIDIAKRSKWDIEGYDIRPCEEPKNISDKLYGIYSENISDINFKNIKINTNSNISEFCEKDMKMVNCENTNIESRIFTGKIKETLKNKAISS